MGFETETLATIDLTGCSSMFVALSWGGDDFVTLEESSQPNSYHSLDA